MTIIEQFIIAAAAQHMVDFGEFAQATHSIDCGEFSSEMEPPSSIEAAMALLDDNDLAIDERIIPPNVFGDRQRETMRVPFVRPLTANEIEYRDMTLTSIDDFQGAF
jgi:hypothetical protein